jgi:hypothetical protein
MQSGAQFSPAERALFMACEFWTAVSGRRLVAHLGGDPSEALRYMSIIYSGISAHGVASAMMMTLGELDTTSHPQARHDCVAALQERLLNTVDPVDRLIARLAENLGLGSPRQVSWSGASEMDSLPGRLLT